MPKLLVRLKQARSGLPARFYTVLILPHSRSRFRKLHLSRGFVLTLAAVGVLTAVAGLATPHLLFRVQTQAAVLEELAIRNSELERERDRFETALSEIARQLDGFESSTRRIAEELGVDDLPSARAAAGGPEDDARPIGGPPRRSPLEDELGAIRGRTEHLDSSIDTLGDAFDDRMRMLASTPNIMPVEGWFSHGFGWRKDPFTGRRQFHRGIDLVADLGTPIRATADGIVSRASRVPDYGKVVDVSHGYGYVTRYGHMSEILVRPGQRVRRGDVIGRVGSTGRSTGPHVHYEVFRDGRRVNPWKYLNQRG